MQENEFDKLFRDKLGDAMFTPPAKVWNGLDSGLSKPWYSSLLTKPVLFIAAAVGLGSAALVIWNQNLNQEKLVEKEVITEPLNPKVEELKVRDRKENSETTENLDQNSTGTTSIVDEKTIATQQNNKSGTSGNSQTQESKEVIPAEKKTESNPNNTSVAPKDAQNSGVGQPKQAAIAIKLTVNSNNLCLNQQLQLQLQSSQNYAEVFTMEYGDGSKPEYCLVNQRLFHQYLQPGSYQIRCHSTGLSFSVNVFVHNLPQAEFEYRISENGITEFITNMGKSEKSTWNFGDGSGWQTKPSTFTYRFKGAENTYPVILAVLNPQTGCSDTFTLSVPNIKGHQLIDVNTFSPNGDGINDYFFFPASTELTYTLIIIDNKGEKVYEGNEKMKGWDGNYPGSSVHCLAGSYRYYLEYTFAGEEKQFKTGFLTLVR